MASHYRTTVIPTRPYKAKAENAVLVVERWIMARLRHHQFFTLEELNQDIQFLLDDLNKRPFKKLPGSRLSQFEAIDKPAMNPLPPRGYQYTSLNSFGSISTTTLSLVEPFTRHLIIWLNIKWSGKHTRLSITDV